MKYIVLIGDGMADYPLPDHGHKTPLQLAKTPNMDRIARDGVTGSARTVPQGFPPGSDVANLSIFGYDPAVHYTGRAPLEAVSMGVPLEPNDTAFRCNLITLFPTRTDVVMDDYSAGHISTEEATTLISALNEKIGTKSIRFYPGVSYRHLMVWKETDFSSLTLTPPHDITGKGIKDHLPHGDGGGDEIHQILVSSQMILKRHEVNSIREQNGAKPANSVWLWGQGRRPVMPAYKERFGLSGAIISAVDLLKGIGICAGFDSIDVPGATGYIDTNYAGKVDAALKALKEKDIVFIHVEAPDEAGHQGSFESKLKAIEEFDSKVVGKILEGIKAFEEFRLLLITDHPTPLSTMTHADDPVPFAVYPAGGRGGGPDAFDEEIVKTSKLRFSEAHRLMGNFILGKI